MITRGNLGYGIGSWNRKSGENRKNIKNSISGQLEKNELRWIIDNIEPILIL